MHHLSLVPKRGTCASGTARDVSRAGFRCLINHIPLCAGPATFEFQPAPYSPGGVFNAFAAHESINTLHLPIDSVDYQAFNPVCSHAAPQRGTSQCAAFATGVLLISTHFTATLGIPLLALKLISFNCISAVEPQPYN